MRWYPVVPSSDLKTTPQAYDLLYYIWKGPDMPEQENEHGLPRSRVDGKVQEGRYVPKHGEHPELVVEYHDDRLSHACSACGKDHGEVSVGSCSACKDEYCASCFKEHVCVPSDHPEVEDDEDPNARLRTRCVVEDDDGE